MRIVYGVHGYGRGHSSRALAVLPELTGRHEVLVLAGGDAYAALAATCPVLRIPVLKYALGKSGKRSAYETVKRALPAVLDLYQRGPALTMAMDVLREFAPDVVVSDSEVWTHGAAARLGVPRISFDHFGILVYCRWPMGWRDRLMCKTESLLYRRFMGRPERIVLASFYDAPPRRAGVRVVGPVLRQHVRQATPTAGDYLLVYFSNGQHHYTPQIHEALTALDVPVRVYGAPRQGGQGKLTFCPSSNEGFVDDLAAARAVFATAGNQLISEALHLGKPLLLMPEDALEQRLNAQAVQQMGAGLYAPRGRVSVGLLRDFWARADEFAAGLRGPRRDGCAEAVEAIETYAAELIAAKS